MVGLRRRPPPGAIPLPWTDLAPPPAVEPPLPSPPPSADPPRADPPSAPALDVRVIRSAKRTRTSSARLVGHTLEIRLPAWMSVAEEAHWVAEWTRRFRRKMTADRIDLPERAALLAGRYDLPRPESIRWVDDMQSRWG